ncbi:MAG TPA: hypothetical protein VLY65_00500 [Nitrososphaerales archaeon]|nr:hypothetical protein [Nitrososphaerales archaeon]
MEGREGEGEDEVSEGSDEDIDRALARYSDQIREKYAEDGGDGELGAAKGGKAETTQEADDKSSPDGAENAPAGTARETADGRLGEEEQGASTEPAKLAEGRPEGAAGEDQEDVMRRHLQEKYPDEEAARPDGMQTLGEPEPSKGGAAVPRSETGEPAEISSVEARQEFHDENDRATGKEGAGREGHSESRTPAEEERFSGQQGADSPDGLGTSANGEERPRENQNEVDAPSGREVGANQPTEASDQMSGKDATDVPVKRRWEAGDEGDRESVSRKAAKYMDSLALIAPSTIVPYHQERGDVFETRVSRASRPEEQYPVYTTHKHGYERAYVPLRHVGAERGEEFLVRPFERYEESGFARDYNGSKPPGLDNTMLAWREGKFVLSVDQAQLELKQTFLRAQEGKAVLDAKLNDEEKNAVKIAKGVDGFDFRFTHDHAIVTSMKESKEGLMVSYERTHHDEFPHVRLVDVETVHDVENEKLETWEHKPQLDSKEIRLDKTIGRMTDSIKIEFSEANARRAWEYWSSATSQSERFYHQGDIGESVARTALEKSGFKTFPKELFEPANMRAYTHESEMRGPDIVVYGNVGGKEGYHICQVKHWREPAKAMKEAREDAIKFRDSKEDRPLVERTLGKEISGSFIIELEWSYKDSVGIIYSEYMEY